MGTYAAVDLVISPQLPIHPRPGEVGKRIVRHGLADVLHWLGEDVGPKPHDASHVIVTGRTWFVSAEAHERLRHMLPTPRRIEQEP